MDRTRQVGTAVLLLLEHLDQLRALLEQPAHLFTVGGDGHAFDFFPTVGGPIPTRLG